MSIERLAAASVRMADGRILVVGGADNSGVLNSAEVYDPQTNTWSATGSMSIARVASSLTLLSNGKVLVVGGCDCKTVEIYDPTSGAWTLAANAIGNKQRTTPPLVLLIDGRVLAVDGQPEVYDPIANQWTTTGPTTLFGATATLLADGRVLAAGGGDVNYPTAASQLYDPVTNLWTAGPLMTTARVAHSALRLADGRVMIAGGVTTSAGILSSVEIYDPSTNTWSVAQPMPVDRYAFEAIRLPSGRVLAIGGTSKSAQIATFSVDIYDPAANSWSPTADLHWRRNGHYAVALGDGRLFVGGGHTGAAFDALRLSSTEVFSETTPVTVVSGGRRPAVDGFLAYAGTSVSGTDFVVSQCMPQTAGPSLATQPVIAFVTAVNGETVFPATARITLEGVNVTPVVPAQGVVFARLALPRTVNVLLGSITGIVPGTTDRATDDADRLTIACRFEPPTP